MASSTYAPDDLTAPGRGLDGAKWADSQYTKDFEKRDGTENGGESNNKDVLDMLASTYFILGALHNHFVAQMKDPAFLQYGFDHESDDLFEPKFSKKAPFYWDTDTELNHVFNFGNLGLILDSETTSWESLQEKADTSHGVKYNFATRWPSFSAFLDQISKFDGESKLKEKTSIFPMMRSFAHIAVMWNKKANVDFASKRLMPPAAKGYTLDDSQQIVEYILNVKVKKDRVRFTELLAHWGDYAMVNLDTVRYRTLVALANGDEESYRQFFDAMPSVFAAFGSRELFDGRTRITSGKVIKTTQTISHAGEVLATETTETPVRAAPLPSSPASGLKPRPVTTTPRQGPVTRRMAKDRAEMAALMTETSTIPIELLTTATPVPPARAPPLSAPSVAPRSAPETRSDTPASRTIAPLNPARWAALQAERGSTQFLDEPSSESPAVEFRAPRLPPSSAPPPLKKPLSFASPSPSPTVPRVTPRLPSRPAPVSYAYNTPSNKYDRSAAFGANANRELRDDRLQMLDARKDELRLKELRAEIAELTNQRGGVGTLTLGKDVKDWMDELSKEDSITKATYTVTVDTKTFAVLDIQPVAMGGVGAGLLSYVGLGRS